MSQEQREQVNIRLMNDDKVILSALVAKLGIDATAVTRLAWRKLAQIEGIKTKQKR